MRDQPIVIEIYDKGSGKIKIPKLELVEPFVKIIWWEYTLYTTESLAKIRTIGGAPRYYIFPNEDGGVDRFTDRSNRRNPMCVGSFYNLMSKEEQSEFDENIEVLLGIFEANEN
jgi:hypothetical protein